MSLISVYTSTSPKSEPYKCVAAKFTVFVQDVELKIDD